MDEEQLHRIDAALNDFYRLHPYRSTQQDFQDWLEQLATPLQIRSKQSYREAVRSTAFRQFYFASYYQQRDEYMRNHLSAEDFQAWKNAEK